MSGPLSRSSYQQLIDEDIKWLLKQPDSLERTHVLAILLDSPTRLYGGGIPFEDIGFEPLPLNSMQMSCPLTVCTTPYDETKCYCALELEQKQENEK